MDPQPGRPDPVRDQRPGPRGRRRSGSRGRSRSTRLDRAVLPLDRDVPHVRDDRPGHPDGPVRQGDRSVVGRPPDAGPLRQRREQPRVAFVAGRDPDAPRGRDRARGEDPQDRPGRDDVDGRGKRQPGRLPRGPELRGHPQAAVHPRRREQRLCDQRAGVEAAGRPGRRHPRRRLRHARRRSSTARTCSSATSPRRRRSTGRGGRRPDADRGEGHPPHRPLVRRPADEVPIRRGARRPRVEGPAAALPGAAEGGRRPDRRARGEDRGRDQGRGRRGHRLLRGRRRSGSRDRDEVGLRRGLAGRDAADLGLHAPRHGRPRPMGRRGSEGPVD